MTTEEALKLATKIKTASSDDCVFTANDAQDLAAYVIERNTPVKPKKKKPGVFCECECSGESLLLPNENFCPKCGKPLDWSHA